jgi:hypothetical protein
MRVTVRDGTTAGETLAALEVQLDTERVTVAELIRARVHQEVRAHNAAPSAGFIDAERQTDVALRAFERGQMLLLVDDRQIDGLEHEVTLRPGSTVTFLKLVPLAGG